MSAAQPTNGVREQVPVDGSSINGIPLGGLLGQALDVCRSPASLGRGSANIFVEESVLSDQQPEFPAPGYRVEAA